MQAGFAQTNRKLDECKDSVADVGAKVDAVDKKVAKLRKNGKPCGRYTKEARALCWNFWETAANHEEVWCSVNTRVTYEAVFNHYKVQLARVGVDSAKIYGKIVHAEVVRRNRELQARQDEARQKSAAKPCTQRGKYGIMRDMKTRVNSALALSLAIAGGLAAPLRSDASVRKGLTHPRSRVTLSAASYAPRSTAPDVQPDARSGSCDCGEKRQPLVKLALCGVPSCFSSLMNLDVFMSIPLTLLCGGK